MTEHAWHTTRARAIELFAGETPRAALEQDIVDVFTDQPTLVIAAVEQVGSQFAIGKIRSGWAVLRTHVVNAAAPVHSVTATDETERQKRTRQAEQLLRTNGPHFDRETEIVDEIFGDRGLLRDWVDDELLPPHIIALWRQKRQRGEQLEHDEAERDERFLAQRRCEHCGDVRPFANRPCMQPACRRKAAAAHAPEPAETTPQAGVF